MKLPVTLLVLALVLVHSTSASAAGCDNCAPNVGGFVSIEQANQLVAASTVTAAVSSAFGILSVAGTVGNITYAIKGERPGRLWANLAFGTGGAAVVLGSCSVALGINLRAIANDVTPVEAQAGVTKAGATGLAIGLAALGAGVLNIGMGVLAMVKPEASTFVSEGKLGFSPIMLLDRQNNVAPGVGATFMLR